MTTRISQAQVQRELVGGILNNRALVDKFANQVSTGLRVTQPGDSPTPGAISQNENLLKRIEGYGNAVENARAALNFQDDTLTQMSEILIRAKELATQAGNETNADITRQQIAPEVFALRNQVVSLVNSKYQGRYVYGCADDDDPPYDASTYTVPATGEAASRYVFDGESGTSTTRSVNVNDGVSVVVNTPANQVFDSSIQALERLGRALQGYQSTVSGGSTTGAGVAYNLPAERSLQTTEINACIDLLTTARANDILPEKVSVAARLTRIDAAKSVLDLGKNDAQVQLGILRDADEAEAASSLVQAQNALQASYTVSARVLNLSILNYI